jgi:hypothetical protein
MVDSSNSIEIVKQIDTALAEWGTLRKRSKYEDLSDLSDQERARVSDILASTLHRLAPPQSHYTERLQEIRKIHGYVGYTIPVLLGALNALKSDFINGHLLSFKELVHADTFASMLEMAEYLLNEGYKDAAAVLCGSVLEQHLRDLAHKAEIEIEVDGRFKKADTINADLAKSNTISKLEQKDVTAQLGLRNAAAHGDYKNYNLDQVALMVAGVRSFMIRHPA